MDISALEEIGLTKSEIKVYLALLKIGNSTTGPIIKESKTADSKIYEVLDRLIDKGIVSYYLKDNLKYYKAASPKMILEFIKEKKKKIEKQEEKINSIMPLLEQLTNEKQEQKESTIFSGSRGIKTAFMNLVDELSKGDEVHIMGVYNFDKKFMPLSLFFQKIRSKKGIKAKFLINNDAKDIGKEFSRYPPIEIKYLPKGVYTPAIFLIYSDKVIINIASELTFFVIKSQSVKDAFEAYFQIMWRTQK